MGIFTGIFDLLAIPLGWLLKLIYSGIPNYFIAIFLFTLIMRIILFPLSLKSQKSQADRAKLAPRIERLKKKYGQDPRKFQEKQQALYEKEGVSLTGGCLPLLVQMLVLFGIISVIYAPLKHLTDIPDAVVEASVSAVTVSTSDGTDAEKEANKKLIETGKKKDAKEFTGYYKELRLLQCMEQEPFASEIKEGIAKLDGYDAVKAQEYYDDMKEIKQQFDFFGRSVLENPWNEKGFAGISILWLIPLISGLTALASSLISMHYTKQLNGSDQPGQGCTNASMLIMMPAFSLFIAFTVPGGVGIYWICSNLIALVQTVVLNKIYNPVKIREQAEIEYEQRRRQRQEDKKRLAEARAKEQRELAQELKNNPQKKPTKKKPEEKSENDEESEEESEE